MNANSLSSLLGTLSGPVAVCTFTQVEISPCDLVICGGGLEAGRLEGCSCQGQAADGDRMVVDDVGKFTTVEVLGWVG